MTSVKTQNMVNQLPNMRETWDVQKFRALYRPKIFEKKTIERPRALWVINITSSLLCHGGGNKLDDDGTWSVKAILIASLFTRCLEVAGMKFVIVPHFIIFVFVIRYSGKLLS